MGIETYSSMENIRTKDQQDSTPMLPKVLRELVETILLAFAIFVTVNIITARFKIEGDTTNIWYLDDDGAGNIRRYRQDGSVRAYGNSTQGTIDYDTGLIEVNSLNVSNIENVRGTASTVIEITVKPNSNDLVPIRNQILEVDVANSTVNVEADTLVGGSANAGIGYTTTSSY